MMSEVVREGPTTHGMRVAYKALMSVSYQNVELEQNILHPNAACEQNKDSTSMNLSVLVIALDFHQLLVFYHGACTWPSVWS